MSLSTTAPTYVTGQVVTAAQLNALQDGIQAAWTAYTPTATNFTVGNGTLTGRWLQIGKSAVIRINFVAGTTSTYTASGAQISLPATAHATGEQALLTKINTSAGILTIGDAAITAGGSTVLIFVPTAAGSSSLAGMSSASVNPGTVGNLVVEGWYEAA